MEIKTKFNTNQEVFFLDKSECCNVEIDSIFVHVTFIGEVKIQYRLNPNPFVGFYKDEKDVFATKEELLNSLKSLK